MKRAVRENGNSPALLLCTNILTDRRYSPMPYESMGSFEKLA